MNSVIDRVASHLGNTRAVCRKCYIHPAVMATWSQGRLGEELAAVRKSRRKTPEGLDEEEAVVLNWLAARDA